MSICLCLVTTSRCRHCRNRRLARQHGVRRTRATQIPIVICACSQWMSSKQWICAVQRQHRASRLSTDRTVATLCDSPSAPPIPQHSCSPDRRREGNNKKHSRADLQVYMSDFLSNSRTQLIGCACRLQNPGARPRIVSQVNTGVAWSRPYVCTVRQTAHSPIRVSARHKYGGPSSAASACRQLQRKCQ